MTDEQALFGLLVIVYLLECVVWMRREAIAFRPAWGRRCRIVGGPSLPGTTRSCGLLASFLPSLHGVIVTQQWPISASPEGVLSYVSQAFNPGGRHDQRSHYLPFAEIRSCTVDGRRVLVNGEPFVDTGSETLSRRLAAFLIGVKDRTPAEREAALRSELRRLFDTEEIARRIASLRRESRICAWAGLTLFVHLFVVCPIAVVVRGLSGSWPWLLILVLLLQGAIVIAFIRAHRKLYPGETAARWSAALGMALLPPAAIRAVDPLSREIVATHHPLGVARELCREDAAGAFATAVVRDLRHPIRPVCPLEGPAAITEGWHRAELLRCAEALSSGIGAGSGSIERAPEPETPASRAYCPRCLCQYVAVPGTCSDCGELPLERLPLRRDAAVREPGSAVPRARHATAGGRRE